MTDAGEPTHERRKLVKAYKNVLPIKRAYAAHDRDY